MVDVIKIGVAVFGVGNMGAEHANAAKCSPYVNKVVGYEPDHAVAQRRAKELGILVTSDLDCILNDPALKLVTIASPNEFHTLLSIKSLEAGKAVFCEKPMVADIVQCRHVLDVHKKM